MLTPVIHNAIYITDKNDDIFIYYVEVNVTLKDIIDFVNKRFKKQHKEILIGKEVIILKNVDL